MFHDLALAPYSLHAGSGAIDWAEFKAMLPKLGVAMNEAKALKYFNMADTNGGGDIDLEVRSSKKEGLLSNTLNVFTLFCAYLSYYLHF